jgi:hypothetical protein
MSTTNLRGNVNDPSLKFKNIRYVPSIFEKFKFFSKKYNIRVYSGENWIRNRFFSSLMRKVFNLVLFIKYHAMVAHKYI